MPATPLRNVRVPDDLWAAAQRRAAEDDTTVSAVIVEHLEQYVDGDTCGACGRPIVRTTAASGYRHAGGQPPGPFHVPTA